MNTECITLQQIKELCSKHGFKYEDKIGSVIYPYCPSWTVINIEFQYHNMVRLYFMKYVFDKKVGVKTKCSGIIKRVDKLTCEAFEKYLEEYIIQYKKVKIYERKYCLNGDFYECKDTE